MIGAVRSDVDNILNVIRQTGLFVKGLAGVATAVSDLPAQIASDAKSTISQFVSTLNNSSLTGPSATNAGVIAAIASITALAANNEGVSQSSVSGGQLGSSAAVSSKLSPSNTVFQNPLQNPLLFNQIPVSSLTLNSAQQNALQNELDTVNSFTVSDLKNMRSTILTLCTQLANSFGAGNAYFSTLYNQPQPIPRVEPMTLDEYDILESFYALLEAYDVLTATNELNDQQISRTNHFYFSCQEIY